MTTTEASKATVYLVQDPPPVYRRGKPITKDLSSAQRYGKLMPILESDDQPSLTPGPMLHRMRKALTRFDPTCDYICYAGGDPMALALAMLVLAGMGLKEVPTLRWDRERDTAGTRKAGGFYVPVNVPTRL